MSEWKETEVGRIPSNWEVLPIGKFADVTKLAGFEYTKYFEYVDDGEIIALRALNVRDGVLDLNDVKRIYKSKSDSLIRSKLFKGDILLTYVGANIGQFAIIDENDKYHLAPNICRIRATEKCLPSFLFSCFRTNSFRDNLINYSVGSSQPTLPMRNIRQIKLPLPPLSEQRAIARILSSLDDKIELNNRMNKTLEEIGQTLFKEWFIDFEFPDEEGNPYKSSGGEMVESELGLIPEGWEVKKLPEIIEIDPLYKLIKNTIAPYVEMKNIPTSSVRVTDFIYRAFTSGSRFKNGDVVFARITPCLENGKTAYIDFLEENQIGWGSTEFIIFSAKHYLPKEYVYFLARNNDFRNYAIKNMSGTSGRQRVPNKCFEDYKVILSDEKTLKLFEKIIGGIFKVIKRNDDEANILKNIRDTLLSKLMSGEIRVKDIS